VLTSEFEKRSLLRNMPWIRGRIRVIPIGSNIVPLHTPTEDHQDSIAYFGLIMPRKGLEDFIDFARLVRAKDLCWNLLIIGKIAQGQEAYAQRLITLARTLRIHWILDRSAEEVSKLLSQVGIGYLPFPDGASERRGSLKAVLTAGLPCITTRTEQTPQGLLETVIFAATPSDALESALRLMTARTERLRLSRAAFEYSQQFTWEKIAESHIQMYQELHAIRQGKLNQ
jgi:glycosyltransferase involved in cell wall biosynthesis